MDSSYEHIYVNEPRETIKGLSPYQPGKPISDLKREYGLSDVIKLASNENPLGPSPLAINAIKQELTKTNFYPDGSGFDLKEKISELKNINTDQITLGNGSDDIFNFILRVFVSERDEVMVSEYGFAAYAIATRVIGADLNVVSSKNWGHDLELMADSITERTKVIFIANPNNPTGTYNKNEEILSFLKKIPKHVVVVIDQAYHEYMLHEGDKYHDAAVYLNKFPNLIVTYTFSKAYGLAGLRIGYSLSSAETADLLNRVRLPFNVNSIGLIAATAALDDEEHIVNTVELNKRSLAFISEELSKLGLQYISLVGNFVTVDMGINAAPIYKAMLKRGVIVRPLSAYGLPGFLRISTGLSEQNHRCIEVLSNLINKGM